MGQEDEEKAELIATIKGEHVEMKNWYNGERKSKDDVLISLHSKYGAYPDFSRDVIGWSGWKDARKAYLQHLERKKNKSGDNLTSAPQQQQQAKRKRRSRWASADESSTAIKSSPTEKVPKRKSRWARGTDETSRSGSNGTTTTTTANNNTIVTKGPPTAATGILGLLPGMPAGMTPEKLKELTALQNKLRTVNEKLSNLDMEAMRVDALPRGHPDRSPSPPPIYGADGVRKNTRSVRWKERYTSQRQDCLEKIMELNPALRPPGFVKRKRQNKIYIPVAEHPTYNFIGLIIGPRGKTQKEMEAKTGCKIAIRGKGSVKEGARGRRDGKAMDGDDDPLHVVITGDDQKSVDEASKMIEDMLVVIDDEKNVHKQQQLRELALLNGTLKDEEYCHWCGDKGHRSFECPKRFTMNKKIVSIKCAICGDTSHPTRDCTLRKDDTQQDEKQIDSAYQTFMDELDGKDTSAKPADTDTCVIIPTTSTTETTQTVAPPVQANTNLPPSAPPAAVSGTNLGTATLPTNPAVPNSLPPPPTTASTHQTVPNVATSTPTTTTTGGVVPAGLPPPPMYHQPPMAIPGMPPPPPYNTYQAPQSGANNNSYAAPPPPPYGQQHQYQAYGYPPPPNNALQSHQQQQYSHHYQQQAGGYYGHQQGQTHAATNSNTNNNNNKNYSNPDDETAGWDYRSYYGSGTSGNDAGGAGGFNWWEQSS
eukprot:CAMPEP_0178941222 /NCGR_PEP_ID=MMETSP0789-20121207/1276_1 /TAXON_ID=3005 /ORGANISM="Rhizosolenia setigera, Strain CCMP 1694" /LENGTH=705 /DNA_ID=CAMNT_0020620411 /DNA_START=109 /DNA_END=2226 /DNA_ORIENTATION=-